MNALLIISCGMIIALSGLRLWILLMLIRRARSLQSEAWNSRERSAARVEIGVTAMGFFLLTLSWIMVFLFLLTGDVPTVVKLLWLVTGVVYLAGGVVELRARKRQSMQSSDREALTRLLRDEVERLRVMSYAELRTYLSPQHRRVVSPAGVSYHIEVQALWDDPRQKDGDLRVIVSGWLPRRHGLGLTEDFIVAPDGSFAGE